MFINQNTLLKCWISFYRLMNFLNCIFGKNVKKKLRKGVFYFLVILRLYQEKSSHYLVFNFTVFNWTFKTLVLCFCSMLLQMRTVGANALKNEIFFSQGFFFFSQQGLQLSQRNSFPFSDTHFSHSCCFPPCNQKCLEHSKSSSSLIPHLLQLLMSPLTQILKSFHWLTFLEIMRVNKCQRSGEMGQKSGSAVQKSS